MTKKNDNSAECYVIQNLLFSMVNQNRCSSYRINVCAIRHDSPRRNSSTFADASWNARPSSLRIESFLLQERTKYQRGILQGPKCALKDCGRYSSDLRGAFHSIRNTFRLKRVRAGRFIGYERCCGERMARH